MVIMLGIEFRENQPVETINSLVRTWYHGQVKDKALLHWTQHKQNTSQLQVSAHNYYRWNIS